MAQQSAKCDARVLCEIRVYHCRCAPVSDAAHVVPPCGAANLGLGLLQRRAHANHCGSHEHAARCVRHAACDTTTASFQRSTKAAGRNAACTYHGNSQASSVLMQFTLR